MLTDASARQAADRERAAEHALRSRLAASGFDLPSTAAEQRQLISSWTAAIVAPYRDELREQRFRVLSEHPRIDEPTYRCCEKPRSCSGAHPPVCGGREHGKTQPRYPCRTVRALDAGAKS